MMAGSIVAIGRKDLCTVEVITNGRTDNSMKDSTIWVPSKAMEVINGRMGNDISDNG